MGGYVPLGYDVQDRKLVVNDVEAASVRRIFERFVELGSATVLAREPRHFGALAGKSVILFNQGKVGLAQIAVKEALKYHPYLNEGAILKSNPGTDL